MKLFRAFKYLETVSGNIGDSVELHEKQWKLFLKYQGIICKYQYTNNGLEPVDTEKFTLDFKRLPYASVVKITKDNLINMCMTFTTTNKL